jgi:succinate dehydrogenase hydrophobic anchor subunit
MSTVGIARLRSLAFALARLSLSMQQSTAIILAFALFYCVFEFDQLDIACGLLFTQFKFSPPLCRLLDGLVVFIALLAVNGLSTRLSC